MLECQDRISSIQRVVRLRVPRSRCYRESPPSMRGSNSGKRYTLTMLSKGFFFIDVWGRVHSITHCLAKEGYATTKAGVYKFVRRYEETATIWGLAKKLTAEAKRIVDEYRRSTVRAYGRSTVHAYGRTHLQVWAFYFFATGVLLFCYGRTNLHVRACVQA